MSNDVRAIELAGLLGAKHKALAQRLCGLAYSDDMGGLLAACAQAEAVLELKDFNPRERRDRVGRWTSGDIAAAHAVQRVRVLDAAARVGTQAQVKPLKAGDEVQVKPDQGFLPLKSGTTVQSFEEHGGTRMAVLREPGTPGEFRLPVSALARPHEMPLSATERSRIGLPPAKRLRHE